MTACLHFPIHWVFKEAKEIEMTFFLLFFLILLLKNSSLLLNLSMRYLLFGWRNNDQENHLFVRRSTGDTKLALAAHFFMGSHCVVYITLFFRFIFLCLALGSSNI